MPRKPLQIFHPHVLSMFDRKPPVRCSVRICDGLKVIEDRRVRPIADRMDANLQPGFVSILDRLPHLVLERRQPVPLVGQFLPDGLHLVRVPRQRHVHCAPFRVILR